MPRLTPPDKLVTIDFDGQPLQAREGETVATALLAAKESVFSRSVKYHRPRGPFCMSAGCSHCLMRVDGVPNVFTCKTKVRAGMRVERQNAYPSAEHDVLGAIDWLFPRGLNHHAMFAGVPVAEQVMTKVARHLAGLGTLPEKPAPERLPQEIVRVKVAIAGGGAAGLAAARELAAANVEYLIVEKEAAVGGRLRYGAKGSDDPALDTLAQTAAGGKARVGAPILGLFNDEDGRYLGCVQYGEGGPRLLKVYAERFLIATGSYATLWPFENNDLPNVFAGRAVAKLVREERFLPGKAFVVAGQGPELYDTARLIEEAGGAVKLVLDVGGEPPAGAPEQARHGHPLKANGRNAVRGLIWSDHGKKEHTTRCDAIALCTPGSPVFELAKQGGAEVRYSEQHQGFVVEADPDGRTAAKELWVAGELLGAGISAAQAAESGAKAGKALAQALSGGGAG